MTPDPWDLEVLARTLWGECRGEPPRGQQAVAWVVVNRRVAHGRWPDTIAGVCLEPHQFGAWDPPALQILLPSVDPVLRECRDIARSVLADEVPDPTSGANHYMTAAAAETSPPAWYDPTKVTARIGRHVFLKLQP